LKDTIFKAYELYQNAIEREKAVKRQVEAAQIALDGMRLQVNGGQGPILDLLISHQNLLSAQVNLTTAQHDEVVYSYQILSLIDGIRIH
jgi:outer membrane protein